MSWLTFLVSLWFSICGCALCPFDVVFACDFILDSYVNFVSFFFCSVPIQAPRPTISMPNSMSNKPGFYDDEPSDSAKPKASAAAKPAPAQDDKKKEAAKG